MTITVSAETPPVSRTDGPPDPNLVKIRDLIYQVAGIFQPDNKFRFLEDRCQRRMKELRVTNYRDYYDCLTIKPIRQAELISLLNEITIGETCFFRNQPQLDALRHIVLPRTVEAKSKLPMRKLAFGVQAVRREKSPTR
jgi:chemotaxis protein methyltransferase CheR